MDSERFFPTTKEQAIHGRVSQTIDEVRDAVRNFAACYNDAWLIEKNGYLSLRDAPLASTRPYSAPHSATA